MNPRPHPRRTPSCLCALSALSFSVLCVNSDLFCFLSLTLLPNSCVHDRSVLNSFPFIHLRTTFVGTEG